MKKLLFFFALILCSLAAWAQTFTAIAPTGQTLKFTITGTNEVSVANGSVTPTGALTIPSTATNGSTTYRVTSIGDYAFFDCRGLTSVTIPNSVTSIGTVAFGDCSGLTNITIPNSVATIGYSAFLGCLDLTSVNYIGTIAEWCGISFGTDVANPIYYAHTLSFNGTPMGTTLTIPNSVTSIGSYAFENCSGLTSVIIPNSVTSIGDYTFADCCGLTSVTIPNSVTIIGISAFSGCNGLTTVTIPNSVTTIKDWTFYYCNGLTSVTIPNSVTSIGKYAFEDCSGLTSVTIGNSVTTIGKHAFRNCSGLTSVTIPNLVSSIGSDAFYICTNLKTVYNLSNLTITNIDFGLNANRVVNCTEHSGSWDNIIYKIPTSYSFVDVEDDVETHIPRSTIPTNIIYRDGSVWKAKNIVLTDDTSKFEASETFTAETATYTREFTNSNRSTLYLPFTASVPSGLEVYDFTSFANNTISFSEHTGDIAAYTPYLVGYELSKDGNSTTCTITKTNAMFPKTSTASPAYTTTNNGMTFKGTTARTCMNSTNYGYRDGFFVRSADGSSSDHGTHAHVNPFRAYFETTSSDASQSLPPTLNVEVGYGDPVGIDAVETPEQEYDGRYGKDVYDMLGRLVRKNADNLEGLPRGIYIWKGKKHFNN